MTQIECDGGLHERVRSTYRPRPVTGQGLYTADNLVAVFRWFEWTTTAALSVDNACVSGKDEIRRSDEPLDLPITTKRIAVISIAVCITDLNEVNGSKLPLFILESALETKNA